MSTLDHSAPGPRTGTTEMGYGPGSMPAVLHELAVATTHVDLAVRAKLGLNAIDYQAVKHLWGNEQPIGPVGLGKLLGISSGSATGLVDRLQRQGHVERRPHPGDRRRQTLAVTERTAAAIATALQPLAAAIDELEMSFAPAERAAIERFLTQALAIHREKFA